MALGITGNGVFCKTITPQAGSALFLFILFQHVAHSMSTSLFKAELESPLKCGQANTEASLSRWAITSKLELGRQTVSVPNDPKVICNHYRVQSVLPVLSCHRKIAKQP